MNAPATFCAALLIAAAAAFPDDPTIEESIVARGRRIYEKGEGESAVTARIRGGTDVPAAVLPCISCHGTDGRGRTEGGITPSDIRYGELTKPYEVSSASGRRRAPYNDALLRRALTMGVDSSGHRFDPLMPRFQMTRSDIDALIAYLHTLGTGAVPGVDEKTIRVAMLLPPENGDAVRAAVSASIAELNAEGGIFGRSIDMRYGSAVAIADLIRSEKPFAVIAANADAADAAVAQTTRTPVLSLYSAVPVTAPDSAAFVRYLAPGVVQQARSLARALAPTTSGTKRVAIIGADAQTEAAQAFRDVAAEQKIEIVDDPDDADALLFLRTPAQLPAVRKPRLLFLASTVTRATGFDCVIALPLPPRTGASAYTRLALAAVKVVAEAARAAGRDLTRIAFLDAVDQMRGLRTGFTPALTWSSTRRIGWMTITVVTLSPDGMVVEERDVDGD